MWAERWFLGIREGWKLGPSAYNVLGKWVETSVEGMLPLGGMLSELGGAMDNWESFPWRQGQNRKGKPGKKEWCPWPWCQWQG